MNGFLVEPLVIVALIVTNGVLSMSEMAIVSARKTRLKEMAEKGHAGAKTAMALASSPSDFLASIQIGITLIGIMAGAFGGVTIAEKLAIPLQHVPLIGSYAGGVSFAIVVVAVTMLTLVLGELVPKRLALSHAERIASAVALPLRVLAKLSAPAVWLLSHATEGIVRLLRLEAKTGLPVTEEEVKTLVEQGKEAGVFEKIEETIIKKTLRLGDLTASDLMTPRVKIVGFNVSDSVEENLKKIAEHPHNYFPIYEENPDNIKGVISVKLIFRHLSQNRKISFADCVIEPLYIPETMPAVRALEEFRRTSKHMALVVDEHGGTGGILTLTDLMNAIVGDAAADGLPDDRKIVERQDGSWLMDGLLMIHELLEFLDIRHQIAEDDHGNYQSLGGFVMSKLGQIPVTGDYFDWQGFRFEVMDMDGHRVDKVLVSRLQAA